MKIKITFKDPDGVTDCVAQEAHDSTRGVKGLSKDERQELADTRVEGIMESLKTWIEYGEYLTVEFDTDANTATVQKVRGK